MVVVDGKDMEAAPGGMIRARRGVCRVCPHVQLNHVELLSWANFSSCGLCGCPLGNLTRLSAKSCPDKPSRWEALQGV